MAAWINEFHYDNAGTDLGEFIEVAGAAGTDLTGWSLVLYNGNDGAAYATLSLSGTIADQQNGFGTLSFTATGLQNGAPDGLALVDGATVVQFLSYEGSFTATGGAANGLTSTDIGVDEDPAPPAGGSLALTGTGTSYADFTWELAADDTPGARNTGQSFGGTATETVSINDVTVAEGDAGTTTLTFTVSRTGNAGAFTVDFTTGDGTAVAGSDYIAGSGTLTFTAGGALSETVTVTIAGDVVVEPDETILLTLANLVNTAGTTTVSDGVGTGTILNDDVTYTEIAAIQGTGHKSPLVTVNTGTGTGAAQAGNSGTARYNVEGVVTAISTNGFWIADPTPDADVATSDGIFVFTGTSVPPPAGLTLGETVRVLGARVDEFRAGTTSGANNNLTITQLNATVGGVSIVELGGNTEITPILIGPGGRIPPFGAIEDDGFTSFNPTADAIDFWESLEGMVVQIAPSTAVSPTAEFRTRDPNDPANAEGPPNEEIWVAVEGALDPSSQTPRGGLILGPTDFNPERVQIDDLLPGVDLPDVNVGARFGAITGVVNYDFQNYEVLVGSSPSVTQPSILAPETTAISRDFRQLTIASYNVENLDPEVESTAPGAVEGSDLYTRLGNSDDDVGSGKYAQHAAQIAVNLGAPTIVALQEVQDNDGAEISSDVDAAVTLQTLVDLIQANHGITYAFAYLNPPGSNQDGGQPNANIRPAYLYRPDQVSLLGLERITDPNPGEADGFAGDDFAASRKPLQAQFEFNGEVITLINNHFNSKGGDNALFGNVQPPVLTTEAQRIEQARIVNDRVDTLLAADPQAKVVVLGDLNDFAWSAPNRTLDGTAGGGTRVLTDLAEVLLPENERYSYNFQGNAQALDHTLVSDALLGAAPAFDIVHVNSEFADPASDHDPSVSRFDFRGFGEKLTLTSGTNTVDGFGGNDTLSGNAGVNTLLGNTGNDVLDGGLGLDRLIGGAGDDLYLLGAERDVVIELVGGGADTMVGTATFRLAEEVEAGLLDGAAGDAVLGNALGNLLLGNSEANRLFGVGGADSLAGAGGNDTLDGGEGGDTLNGGAGRDILRGGLDADVIVIGTAGFQNDVISGFETGLDKVLILGSTLDPSLPVGALDPSRFEANASGQAGAAGGRFVFETDNGRLWWDADGAAADRTLLAVFVNTVGGPLSATDVLIG